MKITAVAFLVLLIAVLIVMILRVQEVKHVRQDVDSMASLVKEEHVEGKTMIHRTALDRIDELEDLCATPGLIEESVDRLRDIAAEAAQWAAGSPAPSPELKAAVAIRAAADSLREYATDPSGRVLSRAQSEVANAKAALSGNAPPPNVTDGLRERVKNLDYSQREKLQELEEAY